MTVDYKIKGAKPCDINRDTVRISALSSWKIDQCEYFTGEAILPSDQSRIQIKIIEDQGEKQIQTHEEHGKQLLKDSDKKSFWQIQNKKKFLKNLLAIAWKKYGIWVNKLILMI